MNPNVGCLVALGVNITMYEFEGLFCSVFAICVLVLFPVYIYVFWRLEEKKTRKRNAAKPAVDDSVCVQRYMGRSYDTPVVAAVPEEELTGE